MEIVIGVVLLIGAFALGQNTADQGTVDSRVGLEREQRVTSSEDQGCRYRVNGPLHRDLTLTYSRQLLNGRAASTETKVAVGNE